MVTEIYYYINNHYRKRVRYMLKYIDCGDFLVFEYMCWLPEAVLPMDKNDRRLLWVRDRYYFSRYFFLFCFYIKLFMFKERYLFLFFHLIFIYYFLYDLHLFFTYFYSLSINNSYIFILFG